MKLNKIFWALMVVALPLSFTACSSSDDDGVNNDTTPYVYKTPANKANQGKYTFDVNNSTYLGKASLNIDPSKTLTLKLPKKQAAVKAFTRDGAEPEYEYIVGDYQKSGDVYTIYVGGKVWGKITVIPVGNGKYTLKIEPAEGEVINADAVKATPLETSESTDKICRTWVPYQTRVMVKKKSEAEGAKGVRTIEGCDFNEVKKIAEEEGCTVDDEFGKDYKITAISFDNGGGLTIKFNKEVNSYVSAWRWASPNDVYANPRDMTIFWETEVNSFIPSTATVDHKAGNFSGQCWLRFWANVESKNGNGDYDVELVLVLTDPN